MFRNSRSAGLAISGCSAGTGCSAATAPMADDVERVLDGVKPHLMVTDPPYGVSYDPAWRQSRGMPATGLATGKVLNDDRADWREAWALFPGDVAYVWHGALHAGDGRGKPGSLPASPSARRSSGTRPGWCIGRGRLSLAARALLVCGAEGQDRALGRRPQADHGLADPAPEVRDRPRHAEAGRVHAAADREQLLARPGGLRAVLAAPAPPSSPPR